MNYNKIFLFLILAFGLSWLGWHVPDWFMEGDSLATPFLQLFMYCWGPAAAAIIVQKGIYSGSMARYGWNRKRFGFSWVLGTMFLPVAIIAATVGMVFMLGNVFHLPGFGEVIFGTGMAGELANLWFLSFLPLNEAMMPQEMWVLWTIILVAGLIGGATVNLLFNVGEEVGWRGFMLVETQSLGFLGSNLILGGLWGLWMLPLVAFGAGISMFEISLWDAMAVVGFAVSAAFPMAYLSIKTRSVYASATFHGVLNNLTILSVFFIWGENPLLGGVKGLAGMFVMLIVTFLILRFDSRFVDEYDRWAY